MVEKGSEKTEATVTLFLSNTSLFSLPTKAHTNSPSLLDYVFVCFTVFTATVNKVLFKKII